MVYTLIPYDVTVFTALQLWLMDALALPNTQVIHEMYNEVPMPQGGFVLMNHVSKKELNTTVQTYNTTSQITSFEKSTDYTLQVDCYGPSAADWITIIQTFWKCDEACEFLEPYGFDPLYAEDAQHIQFSNAEEQYEERWTCRLHLQYNALITTSFPSTVTVTTGVISVSATYH
jgi:hypothetical protein